MTYEKVQDLPLRRKSAPGGVLQREKSAWPGIARQLLNSFGARRPPTIILTAPAGVRENPEENTLMGRPSLRLNMQILMVWPVRNHFRNYRKAMKPDPTSFWWNYRIKPLEIDAEYVKQMVEIFLKVIVAPKLYRRSSGVLGTKENLRVLKLDDDILYSRQIMKPKSTRRPVNPGT